jgi:transcription antitermination factor NusB
LKGRRRARQIALQALYELDQSDHSVADVIAGRLDTYFRAVLRNELDGRQSARLSDALMASTDLYRDAEAVWQAVDAATVARRYGLDLAEIESALALLREHEPQATYAVRVVRGVLARRAEIDAVIARIAPEWPVDQMAPVDRNCLRIALWEIASDSAPMRVVINESVELARRFSGEGARRMVNGALGAYSKAGPGLDFSAGRGSN